jgi:hydroxycarboxylate dehydrogenase B
MKDITLPAARWLELCQRIIRSWGTPEDAAACVAHSLIDSELSGMASHGVIRLVSYYACVKNGSYDPAGSPEIVKESAATALVDGHWGFGQPAAHKGLEVALAKARAQGIAGVGIIHAGHIGRLGEYAEEAAAQGMIAIVTSCSGGPSGWVTPFGGAERLLSTNPIAAGVPAREHTPFIMDYATTVIAAGKLEFMSRDAKIPEGWSVNPDGKPTTTVGELMDGGAMLPFGGHKGYALALLIELLSGALTGAGVVGHPRQAPDFRPGSNADFIIALDIPHFTDENQFYADVDGLFDRVKHVKPAAGFEKVMIPGEPEAQQRSKKAQTGITVSGQVMQQVEEVAKERHVKLEDLI